MVVEPAFATFEKPLRLESGAELPSFQLCYETYGALNGDRSNAILVFHGVTSNAHAAGRHAPDDRKPGWWDAMIGPGRCLDTDRYCVICANSLGGCDGSTGPASKNPATSRPYRMDFPVITLGDIAATTRRLLEHLGVSHPRAVIGGSMGGLLALQWGFAFADSATRIIALAAGPRANAQTLAFNHVLRSAIMMDPAWNDGNYTTAPKRGLALAAMIAHTTWLGHGFFESRFGRQRIAANTPRRFPEAEFEAERFIRSRAGRLGARFDANSYLYLTRAVDYFDLAEQAESPGSLDRATESARSRFLLISFTSDWRYPPAESAALHAALRRAGRDSEHLVVDTDNGHASFLLDVPKFEHAITTTLD